MAIYLLDTNTFIQAYRAYYPPDVMPGYWKGLAELARLNKIVSIDKVENEIIVEPETDKETEEKVIKDWLTIWCSENLPQGFFRKTNKVIYEYQQVIQWANSENTSYHRTAIEEFARYDNADAWLVAYAWAKRMTLVTYEVSQPGSKRSIKIPDAANQFDVRSLSPMEMFRELKHTF